MARWSALIKKGCAKGRITFLSALFVIPVNDAKDWQVLEYKSIPNHQVHFGRDGMTIMVKKSASPIVFPLPQMKTVTDVIVSGEIKGQLNRPGALIQGEKGYDDFRLRIGLVVEGSETLPFWKRWTTPKWVRTLFDLAPKGTGIDRIWFLNMVDDKKLLGQGRTHVLSRLIYEDFVWYKPNEGRFSFEHKLKQPMRVAALWISVDGDDTKSSFTIKLKKLRIRALDEEKK